LQKNILRYLEIFWPVILYTIVFVLYCSQVRNFYASNVRYDRHLLAMTLIGCFYVLPGLGIIQLVFGIIKLVKSRNPRYWYIFRVWDFHTVPVHRKLSDCIILATLFNHEVSGLQTRWKSVLWISRRKNKPSI